MRLHRFILTLSASSFAILCQASEPTKQFHPQEKNSAIECGNTQANDCATRLKSSLPAKQTATTVKIEAAKLKPMNPPQHDDAAKPANHGKRDNR